MTHRRPPAPAVERALLVALARAFDGARDDPSRVVLEGFHALKHALRFGAAIDAAAASDPDGLAALARELAPDVAAELTALAVAVPREELRRLAPRLPHTEVVAVARRPAFSPAAALAARPERPAVLLEDPRHLGNVGAVVRVAAAADAAAVVTTGPRDPWDPAAVRGAAGLHFALPVGSLGADAAAALAALDAASGVAGAEAAGAGAADAGAAERAGSPSARRSRPLVALDPAGEPLGAAPLPAGALLAFGTERHGLSEALLARADRRLALPMRAGVSSLNLATAVAAVLYGARIG
ncbi:TrmH family RNA methyltransferase [Conexibacter arvalis]|uniref:TrmH family RNA methyltransferase n=1 Tax=Conexibacter arvalis TaxID=912552 RepID=A0A840IM22_9ACTN|nr:TrmH family RNA methyltransferase [Conexibacter arvalis]MBB4664910.1 TrmH family RNA methyltransferase [Conexibacter arvalis]